MNYESIILNRLLDKYEISKSLTEDSKRRIILKMTDIKEYDIENYETKAILHDVVFELKKEGIIDYSWEKYEKREYIRKSMVK